MTSPLDHDDEFHVRIREIAEEMSALVVAKNKSYGSSFKTSADALKLLYPDGIRPDQYQAALLFARIWDKLGRIAHAKDAFGESPYRNLVGYSLLGAAMAEEKRSAPSTEPPHG